MIHQIFGSVWSLLYLVWVVGMVGLVLLRKREPASAIGWSLAIVLLPLLGSLLFLVFGMTRLPRRLRRKMRHHEGYLHPARPAAGGAEVGTSVAVAWARLGPLLEHLDEPGVAHGNRVHLLEPGLAAFERMSAAIAGARHHIHLEVYIFRNDPLGRRLLDLLVERAQAGVEVRLCVDYVGTLSRWWLLRRLRRVGGEGAVFLPLFAFGKRFVPNLRNHRKLLVCDGTLAFFGGLNVGEEYLGRKKLDRDWCDLHVEVEGPAARDVQRVFVEDWDFAAGKRLQGEAYFPAPTAVGDSPVQFVSGGPDREVNPIHELFFRVLTQAQRSIRIASPYVVPDPALRQALASAARGGVRIDIVTQSWPPDHYLAEFAASYFFDDMLAAGIHIHRYMPGMMHGKALIIDDDLAILGSANLDSRSLQLNFEVMGVFYAAEDVRAMATRFDEILARSEEVTPEAYARRGRLRRVAESLARLLAPLL